MHILIVDDHSLFREGLRHILSQLDDNLEILEAERCDVALSLAESHPDLSLVMLDIAMPDMDGCESLKLFSTRYPALPVVMLTASDSVRDMRRAFDYGASGYIPKSSSANVMLGALRVILAGGIYVPPSLAGISNSTSTHAGAPANSTSIPGRAGTLTRRQKEVLGYLQEGLSNKQIAAQMALSEATIKVHMSAILKALGAQSRTEAALMAHSLLDNN